MTQVQMPAREEELQIEIERLRAWLYKIQIEAFKGTEIGILESLAEQSLLHSSAACHPQWGATQDWAKLGRWPNNTIPGTDQE